jgi:hypothetical protein
MSAGIGPVIVVAARQTRTAWGWLTTAVSLLAWFLSILTVGFVLGFLTAWAVLANWHH